MCFGDWGSHSSAAYRGEFFLQNGANSYNEPGVIIRQDDNTSDGTDQIICQIVDNPSTSGSNPKDFEYTNKNIPIQVELLVLQWHNNIHSSRYNLIQ